MSVNQSNSARVDGTKETLLIMADDFYTGPKGKLWYYNKTSGVFVSSFDVIHRNRDMRVDFECSREDLEIASQAAAAHEVIVPESVRIFVAKESFFRPR